MRLPGIGAARAFAKNAVRVAALVLLGSVLRAALHDVSQAWDSLYYHLPFAARFAGILGPNDYSFSPDNEERFAGYALLAERLQGALFRLVGRPEGANLLAFFSVPALAVYLKVRHRVSASVAVFAFFALPLVQTHATSAYVDLPANACAALFLLEAFTLANGHARPHWKQRRVKPWQLALALVPGVLAAHMRFQLAPTVLLGLMMLTFVAWKSSKRWTNLAFLAASVPFVYGKLVSNFVRFGNPVYPVELSVLGHALPFHETRYSSSPDYLEHSAQPIRFVCSLLEIGFSPLGTPSRWTVDQYAPAGTATSRMGGTFAPYVVTMVALLVALAASRATKGSLARRLLGFGLALTLVVAPSPQSHELRYYMVWPIVLVASVLVGARSGLRLRPSTSKRPVFPRVASALVPVVALSAFGVVAVTTSYEWITPSGSTFPEVLAKKVDRRVIDSIRDGESVCLWRTPYTFLYASKFHGRRYRLVEGESPAGCGAARRIE